MIAAVTGPATHGERPADGRRERWNDHRARRRAALVAAGVKAIDTYGPESSAEEIAVTARVSRTVLYRYFRDKEDLRIAISRRVVDIVVAELLPPLRTGKTPNEIIGGTLESLTVWVEAHPRLYEFLRQRGASGEPALGDIQATMADQLADLLGGFMVWFGIETRLAQPAAQSIVGMVEHTIAWWMKTGKLSRKELVVHLSRAIWDVIDGELRRSNVTLGPDDPLPVDAVREQRA
jgi:AcrR family transcriptional regulator